MIVFVPDRSIISSRPPASSEAQGAPESHTARTKKETTAQSELEEGEIRSEDDEEEDEDVKDDDQNATRDVSCVIFPDDDDDDQDDASYDLNKKSNNPTPRRPPNYGGGSGGGGDDDDDIQNAPGSEKRLVIPSSSCDNTEDDVEVRPGDVDGPAVQNAGRLPSCLDDVTKEKSDSLGADAPPFPLPLTVGDVEGGGKVNEGCDENPDIIEETNGNV